MPCAHAAILAAKLGVDDGGEDDGRTAAAGKTRRERLRRCTVANVEAGEG